MQPGQDPIGDLIVWGFIFLQLIGFGIVTAVVSLVIYKVLPRRTRRKVMDFFFIEE